MFDPAKTEEWQRHDRAVTVIVGGLSFAVFALGVMCSAAIVLWP